MDGHEPTSRFESRLASSIMALSRQSVIYKMLKPAFGSNENCINHVGSLRQVPMGMLFYNQRALFLLLSGVYCAVLLVFSWFTAGPPSLDNIVWQASFVLTSAWATSVLVTLARHRWFLKELVTIRTELGEDLPPKFFIYYWIDFFTLAVTASIGWYFNLGLQHVMILMILLLVIHSSYVGRQRGLLTLICGGALFLAAGVHFWFLNPLRPALVYPRVFWNLLNVPPIILSLLFTTYLTMGISALRRQDIRIHRKRLERLDQYRQSYRLALGPYGPVCVAGSAREVLVRNAFQTTTRSVLKDICSQSGLFWCKSAAVWWVVGHKDRGRVLVLDQAYGYPIHQSMRSGIDAGASNPAVIGAGYYPSVREAIKRYPDARLLLGVNEDAEVFVVELTDGTAELGKLVFLGGEESYVRPHDIFFVNHLGSLITDAYLQSEDRETASAIRELDGLLNEPDIKKVFSTAAAVLQKHLHATGCIVMSRERIDEAVFTVEASPGLERYVGKRISYDGLEYSMTMECIRSGAPARVDDVRLHEDKFAYERLKGLEQAIGQPIESWMAAPIGSSDDNLGVVKALNKKQNQWFTPRDEELAERLVNRLHVIIKRVKQLKAIEEERKKWEEVAAEAKTAEEKADRTAVEREEDLMAMTHQLVGPLTFLSRRLKMRLRDQAPGAQFTWVRDLYDMTEDGLCLATGIYKTLARQSGGSGAVSFTNADIDADAKMREMADRLQRSEARDDLRIVFKKDDGFPTVRMDESAFVSILYSLIHNAMKYADPKSYVELSCSFERATGEAALKVITKGEVIQPHETELIFAKFGRGYYVRQGRHHTGGGLGLWVARQLAEACGGHLRVELSPTQPRLAVFVLTVPYE